MKSGSLTLTFMLPLSYHIAFRVYNPKNPLTQVTNNTKASLKGKLLQKKVKSYWWLLLRRVPSLALAQMSLDLEKWWDQILEGSSPMPPRLHLDPELPVDTGHASWWDSEHTATPSPITHSLNQQSLRFNQGPHNGLGIRLAMVTSLFRQENLPVQIPKTSLSQTTQHGVVPVTTSRRACWRGSTRDEKSKKENKKQHGGGPSSLGSGQAAQLCEGSRCTWHMPTLPPRRPRGRSDPPRAQRRRSPRGQQLLRKWKQAKNGGRKR